MQGTLLAPNPDQRQAYGRSLHIYGKLNVKLPLRLATLADNYEVCSACVFGLLEELIV